MKILLANPPVAGRFLVRRGNYCSDTSKARYREPPVDLVILSGILSGHELSYIDGILPGTSAEECYEAARNVDAVVLVMSFVARENDIAFVRELRRRHPQLIIVAGGDVVRFEGRQFMRDCPELDALLLDYTTASLPRFLNGETGELKNLIRREETERSTDPVMERDRFNIPVPRHELFMDARYMSAIAIHRRQAITVMSFGCPSHCTFCAFETIPYKLRELESAKAEMRHIRELGFQDIHFADATFVASPKWSKEFLEFMADEIRLPWWCSTRADNLDEDLIKLMKRAGCHSITIGVETASDAVNDRFQKKTCVDQTRSAFALCRRYGIRILGHFIVGLPGETIESTRATINYAIELDPFYASFNLAEPMAGTSFGKEYRERHGLDAKQEPALTHCFAEKVSGLTYEQARDLRNEAVRRFYFRPRKIAQTLLSARSAFEVEKIMANGLELLRRH